mmetsp:Transcript_9928/g.30913  ORF Transcript_9928/g.30913 Transcript_9928/m.30913 type:complete len:212 (+) Transcript_9928:5-640(+)
MPGRAVVQKPAAPHLAGNRQDQASNCSTAWAPAGHRLGAWAPAGCSLGPSAPRPPPTTAAVAARQPRRPPKVQPGARHHWALPVATLRQLRQTLVPWGSGCPGPASTSAAWPAAPATAAIPDSRRAGPAEPALPASSTAQGRGQRAAAHAPSTAPRCGPLRHGANALQHLRRPAGRAGCVKAWAAIARWSTGTVPQLRPPKNLSPARSPHR